MKSLTCMSGMMTNYRIQQKVKRHTHKYQSSVHAYSQILVSSIQNVFTLDLGHFQHSKGLS